MGVGAAIELPELEWTRALVVGAGASGLAAARLLTALGLEVRIYDRATPSQLPAHVVGFTGAAQVPAAALEGIDLLVLSPGVPPGPVRKLQQTLAPAADVHGELSLSLAILKRIHPNCPAVLITGTNGKSTVTALLGEVFAAAGRDAFVGGNLGIPLSTRLLACLNDASKLPDTLVLECSSYQLETLTHHPTAVAMLLNITPDHLARYASLDAYATTKARIFSGLGAGGLALFDATDSYTARFRGEVPALAKTVLVDGSDSTSGQILGDGPGQHLRLPSGETLARSHLQLAGRHNSKNALFVLLAARHLGVSLADCQRGLERFTGLAHRMVQIAEIDGIAYYNDSKATNVASVLAGLAGFDRPFVLIAGGTSKGDDYTLLRDLLARDGRGRGLVVIGESGPAIAEATAGVVPTLKATSMAQAVAQAKSLTQPGDAVVLSPACSSFDWYTNFRHRGDVFSEEVRKLADTS